MKKILVVLLTFTLFCCTMLCTPVSAVSSSKETKITIEYLENGDYIETIIIEESTTRGTKTGSKTNNYKNNNGETMWSLKITGTFTYNGTTATCTSCSHSATSYSSAWSIKSASSVRVANTAKATATATLNAGLTSFDYDMTVTLKCSETGTLS